jgi:hypothetical protein
MNKKLVNTLIDKAEGIRGLLEADFNAFENWNDEINAFLEALDNLEGSDEWECLREKVEWNDNPVDNEDKNIYFTVVKEE